MASVEIRDVRKAFGTTQVIHGVDISIRDGEFVVLVGPSGCGKSTLLRMIAGLENITAGEIRIGERVVNNLPPKERDIAMVFQNYALYPHMTVADNMGFSLKLRGAPKSEIEDARAAARPTSSVFAPYSTAIRASSPAASASASRWAAPSCAIRRSSCSTSRCPISTPSCASQMRTEIKELHQRLKTTTVYVTHDQVEAMTMADKIVVMHDGSGRADRRAARALRPAEQSVRRRLHRLAGDELPQGHASATTAAPASKDRPASSSAAAPRPPTPATGSPRSTASGRSISPSPTTAPRPRSR